ncbi:transcriptional regulator [Nocardioides mangrovicus]|uniref:Transcriptional regulator n=1 Tax=Nocardioides mangrovicus TaxID=2478913 RepID=A0A3L8NXZ8_9ACTN|nr:helix-turn-helix domain-containing protein [Nocardioides mangrovicus]RLV47701.1 transcriptional regulator [Nocardioides mangrovicus]
MKAQPAVEHEPRVCDAALSAVFEVLGKRWNGMLLSVLGQGPAGFSAIARSLGVSDSVLSDRLSELTRLGLVERTVEPGPPVAVTYGLTDAGVALLPSLQSLGQWARENLPKRG